MISNQMAFLIVGGFFLAVVFFVYGIPFLRSISIYPDPCAKGHDFKLMKIRSSCSKICTRCGFTEIISNVHDFGIWKDGERVCWKCGYVEVQLNCLVCGTELQMHTYKHAYGGSHSARECPNCNGRWCDNCGRKQLFVCETNEWNDDVNYICNVCKKSMN